jgi:hypothetical protein
MGAPPSPRKERGALLFIGEASVNDHPYLLLRLDGRVPVSVALAWIRQAVQLHRRLGELRFAWDRNLAGERFAAWEQDEFELTATIVDDPDGWHSVGLDALGEFTDRWRPGAVRHHRGNHHSCRWFIPIDLKIRHSTYRRACEYGHGWSYVAVVVRARRHGVLLGEASLGGIESDAAEDFFSATALDLAHEAIACARFTVRELCAGHSSEPNRR